MGVFVEDPSQQTEDVVDDNDGGNKRGSIEILRDQRQAIEAPHFSGVVLNCLKSVAEKKKERKKNVYLSKVG